MPRYTLLLCLAACTDPTDPEPEVDPPETGPAITFDDATARAALDFGSAHCGNSTTKGFPVFNRRQHDLVLAIDSTLGDIQPTKTEITIPRRGNAMILIAGAYRTRAPQTGELVLTAEETTVTLPTAIAGDPSDAQVGLDPVIDFGQVLPNTTYDRAIQPTSDNTFRDNMVLGTSSTPRFAVVGSSTALLSTVDHPTFTIRLITGDAPIEYSGTIPISLPFGTCVPEALELHALVVP